MAKKVTRIGVDLDGVLAMPVWGDFWVRVRKAKENFFKKSRSPNYYYPTGRLEMLVWRIINSQRKPFKDAKRIAESILKKNNVELYLVTSRFKFLEELTRKWLRKYELNSIFKEIVINVDDLDPLVFKAKAAKDFKLDYFIDDDLEVMNYLRKKTRRKLFWVTPQCGGGAESEGERVVVCKNLIGALEKIVRKL